MLKSLLMSAAASAVSQCEPSPAVSGSNAKVPTPCANAGWYEVV